MASVRFHIVDSTLQAMPVAMVFSKQLLLTEKSSVAVEPGSPDASMDNLTLRATKMTRVLTEIEGYSHGGLNE